MTSKVFSGRPNCFSCRRQSKWRLVSRLQNYDTTRKNSLRNVYFIKPRIACWFPRSLTTLHQLKKLFSIGRNERYTNGEAEIRYELEETTPYPQVSYRYYQGSTGETHERTLTTADIQNNYRR